MLQTTQDEAVIVLRWQIVGFRPEPWLDALDALRHQRISGEVIAATYQRKGCTWFWTWCIPDMGGQDRRCKESSCPCTSCSWLHESTSRSRYRSRPARPLCEVGLERRQHLHQDRSR